MEQDLDWLGHEVGRLQERCDELEKENFELKRCIGRAITNLERDNQLTRDYIENEQTKIVAFTPNFKKPKWEAQD
jgi:hypothetical protein